MAARPAAGPLTPKADPLYKPTTMPPMIPAMRPAMSGAPLASAMPRQSGMATRNTTTDEGTSLRHELNRFFMKIRNRWMPVLHATWNAAWATSHGLIARTKRASTWGLIRHFQHRMVQHFLLELEETRRHQRFWIRNANVLLEGNGMLQHFFLDDRWRLGTTVLENGHHVLRGEHLWQNEQVRRHHQAQHAHGHGPDGASGTSLLHVGEIHGAQVSPATHDPNMFCRH